jgi:urease accessory protein
VTAQLTIQLAELNGITFLQKCYYDPPFNVANITEDRKGSTLRLMLMSSSPGILDADEYRIAIKLQENCSLQLHTQSYQRLFTMKQQASQHTTIHLDTGSSFCFIPHPVVPHHHSNFVARTDIFLSENCSLLFGEVLTCGRKLNGEVFSFSRYHNIVRLFMHDRLVIKENLLMDPLFTDPAGIGQLQGYTHQASLVYIDEKASAKDIIPQLLVLLEGQKDISIGLTAAPVNGIILRLLGQKAEQLFDCLKLVAGHLLQLKSEKRVAYVI